MRSSKSQSGGDPILNTEVRFSIAQDGPSYSGIIRIYLALHDIWRDFQFIATNLPPEPLLVVFFKDMIEYMRINPETTTESTRDHFSPSQKLFASLGLRAVSDGILELVEHGIAVTGLLFDTEFTSEESQSLLAEVFEPLSHATKGHPGNYVPALSFVRKSITVTTDAFQDINCFSGTINIHLDDGPDKTFDFVFAPGDEWELNLRLNGQNFLDVGHNLTANLLSLDRFQLLILGIVMPSLRRAGGDQEAGEDIEIESIDKDGLSGQRQKIHFQLSEPAVIALRDFLNSSPA